jgi:hypothetical protein
LSSWSKTIVIWIGFDHRRDASRSPLPSDPIIVVMDAIVIAVGADHCRDGRRSLFRRGPIVVSISTDRRLDPAGPPSRSDRIGVAIGPDHRVRRLRPKLGSVAIVGQESPRDESAEVSRDSRRARPPERRRK